MLRTWRRHIVFGCLLDGVRVGLVRRRVDQAPAFACGDDWHDSLKSQLFHEQVSETGIH